MCVFRVNVARLCGLNAAIIAEYLWQLYNNEACGDPEMYRHGDYWVRKSALIGNIVAFHFCFAQKSFCIFYAHICKIFNKSCFAFL